MRLNRLDRYVAANVLGSYAASLLFLVFLMIVFETLRNVADYARVASKLGLTTMQLATMIGRYHLLNIPFLFVSVAPFVTVIAVMFAVSRLMAQNEIVPMLFTGRSMLRVLRPAFAELPWPVLRTHWARARLCLATCTPVPDHGPLYELE